MNEPRESTPLLPMLELGLASGVMAGLAFLIAECAITAVLGGQIAAPLRLPATILFGPAALGSFFPVLRAAFVGIGTNLFVSAILGVAWVLALSRLRWLRASPLALAPLGIAYGTLIWLVGDIIVGALAFPQVAVADLLWGGMIGHAVFFGGMLAAAVAVMRTDRAGDQ